MSTLMRVIKVAFRQDTKENWALANTVLDMGMPGYEYDDDDPDTQGRVKIGDGHTAWNDLPYWEPASTSIGDGAVAGLLSDPTSLSHMALVDVITDELEVGMDPVLIFNNGLL